MLLWTTDTHFDHIKHKRAALEFGRAVANENPEATGMVVTGDIANGKTIANSIEMLAEGFGKPVYFVLGNHDYYGRQWKVVDEVVARVAKRTENLHWLTDSGFVMLGDVALCGADGWYDAYYGNCYSSIDLSDFYVIKDLAFSTPDLRLECIRKRAGDQADIMARQIREAVKISDTILVATHVPPFQEAAWHMGEMSDREWAPWFSSASTGMMLTELAKQNKDKKFIVLCGHSHSPGIYEPSDNITVYTGQAKYGFPELTGMIDIDKQIITAFDSARKQIKKQL